MTKIAQLLVIKGMRQRDFQKAIFEKHGILIGEDRISNIVSGKITNYHLKTAKLIAETLNVTIDDIVE